MVFHFSLFFFGYDISGAAANAAATGADFPQQTDFLTLELVQYDALCVGYFALLRYDDSDLRF
jgi:hypothetical protein